uniref:Imidazole glycerol-phosphate synthase n=1 Tax=Fagus sylvatica TaxID=28930 RepID=A0A2N9HJU3_FAGSY
MASPSPSKLPFSKKTGADADADGGDDYGSDAASSSPPPWSPPKKEMTMEEEMMMLLLEDNHSHLLHQHQHLLLHEHHLQVSFLNITGFQDFPLGDLPMLQVLRYTSENVFVPLTVGGGIRDFTDANGRSVADKISIGSDAVYAAEEYLRTGVKTGKSSLEQISRVYGNQAVVVSIDLRRVYLKNSDDVEFKAVQMKKSMPGISALWQPCQGKGFDIGLTKLISDAVSIPVIASSGAGGVEHFSEVFAKTNASAALAAGIFHRNEIPVTAMYRRVEESFRAKIAGALTPTPLIATSAAMVAAVTVIPFKEVSKRRFLVVSLRPYILVQFYSICYNFHDFI